MCLYLYTDTDNQTSICKCRIGSDLSNRFEKSKRGEITCWKLYNKIDIRLRSIVMGDLVNGSGIIKSDRVSAKLTPAEISYSEITQGIHVYTSREEARTYEFLGCDRIIVPVICKEKDLVAEGVGSEAVFMKVRIDKKTWKKIFSPKTEKKL